MEREAREEDVKRGLEQGREQGIEQGLEAMMSKLRKSGIDESSLESAVSEVRKTIAEGTKKQEADFPSSELPPSGKYQQPRAEPSLSAATTLYIVITTP